MNDSWWNGFSFVGALFVGALNIQYHNYVWGVVCIVLSLYWLRKERKNA